MKTRILLSAVTLSAMAFSLMADPDQPTTGMDRHLDQLQKKVDSDLAGGMLTKPDADELEREIAEVKNVKESQPELTGKTRRDLREKISKIEADLTRKEAQAKALASASPTP